MSDTKGKHENASRSQQSKSYQNGIVPVVKIPSWSIQAKETRYVKSL
jgi:hypothetical protein